MRHLSTLDIQMVKLIMSEVCHVCIPRVASSQAAFNRPEVSQTSMNSTGQGTGHRVSLSFSETLSQGFSVLSNHSHCYD